jgi:very-short-patch-repair endonuclease
MARKLRKEMSPPERLLWSALRTRPGGFRFRKQHPFGAFAMDFCCLEARVCIEVDGDAHDFAARAERDAKRDARLLDEGYRTLRIPAREVFRDLEGTVTAVVETCRRFAPPRNGEVARRRRDGGVEGRGSEALGPSTIRLRRTVPLPVPGRSRNEPGGFE